MLNFICLHRYLSSQAAMGANMAVYQKEILKLRQMLAAPRHVSQPAIPGVEHAPPPPPPPR